MKKRIDLKMDQAQATAPSDLEQRIKDLEARVSALEKAKKTKK